MSKLEKLFSQVGEQQDNRREWKEGGDAFSVADRLKDEVEELVEALNLIDVQEHPILEVAGEIGDCLYLLASLCHHVGLDAAECLEQKVYRNASKYPDTFLSNGWKRDVAVNQSKTLYEVQGGDKAFYGWMNDHMDYGDESDFWDQWGSKLVNVGYDPGYVAVEMAHYRMIEMDESDDGLAFRAFASDMFSDILQRKQQ